MRIIFEVEKKMKYFKNNIKSIFDWEKIIIVFIFASLIHIILDSIFHNNSTVFYYLLTLDFIVTSVFIIDYIYRIARFTQNNKFKTPKFLLFIFSPSMLIDLLSILPLIIFIFDNSLASLGFLRLLRVARLFKLLNKLESNSLLIDAIISKKTELMSSMQIVMLLTIILSSVLYYVEFSVQPENFSNIITSFLWSFSKFIGDIGAYGDFAPQTPIGKIAASLVGLLGIAIFAIPAGLIASGFIEQIEIVQKKKQLIELNRRLSDAFNVEYLAVMQRIKNELGLEGMRTKSITMNDIKYKLKIPENDLFMLDNEGKNIRIRNYSYQGNDKTVVEFYDENTVYGTFYNRNSVFTIISTHSKDQPFLGHFSYCIAECLKANYVSIELFSKDDMISEKSLSTAVNDYWINMEKHPILDELNNHLKILSVHSKVGVLFRGSNEKLPTYNILNGGNKGDGRFIEKGNFENVEKLNNFKIILTEHISHLNQTTSYHEHYGNNEHNNISRYLKDQLKIDNITIHTNAGLLKDDSEVYYKSVKLLSESIKSLYNKFETNN